jgi:hypothetical protein
MNRGKIIKKAENEGEKRNIWNNIKENTKKGKLVKNRERKNIEENNERIQKRVKLRKKNENRERNRPRWKISLKGNKYSRREKYLKLNNKKMKIKNKIEIKK